VFQVKVKSEESEKKERKGGGDQVELLKQFRRGRIEEQTKSIAAIFDKAPSLA